MALQLPLKSRSATSPRKTLSSLLTLTSPSPPSPRHSTSTSASLSSHQTQTNRTFTTRSTATFPSSSSSSSSPPPPPPKPPSLRELAERDFELAKLSIKNAKKEARRLKYTTQPFDRDASPVDPINLSSPSCQCPECTPFSHLQPRCDGCHTRPPKYLSGRVMGDTERRKKSASHRYTSLCPICWTRAHKREEAVWVQRKRILETNTDEMLQQRWERELERLNALPIDQGEPAPLNYLRMKVMWAAKQLSPESTSWHALARRGINDPGANNTAVTWLSDVLRLRKVGTRWFADKRRVDEMDWSLWPELLNPHRDNTWLGWSRWSNKTKAPRETKGPEDPQVQSCDKSADDTTTRTTS
ncbi:hypothetical protein QBC35DRAFT_477294 [Podospora australis]|uniref:Uncharacterized protein n=1 Tax=Podospora australis TaxID=1536484 RepID=A0AAN6WM19_9PEZI|nr:hypothetical protein QBC35DRAFT_477294 [Podospora australis]